MSMACGATVMVAGFSSPGQSLREYVWVKPCNEAYLKTWIRVPLLLSEGMSHWKEERGLRPMTMPKAGNICPIGLHAGHSY